MNPIPNKTNEVKLFDGQSFIQSLTCPVEFTPLTQAVSLAPCTHKINETVAITLYGKMNEDGVAIKNKPCSICNVTVKAYYPDHTIRDIARNIFAIQDPEKSLSLLPIKPTNEKSQKEQKTKKSQDVQQIVTTTSTTLSSTSRSGSFVNQNNLNVNDFGSGISWIFSPGVVLPAPIYPATPLTIATTSTQTSNNHYNHPLNSQIPVTNPIVLNEALTYSSAFVFKPGRFQLKEGGWKPNERQHYSKKTLEFSNSDGNSSFSHIRIYMEDPKTVVLKINIHTNGFQKFKEYLNAKGVNLNGIELYDGLDNTALLIVYSQTPKNFLIVFNMILENEFVKEGLNYHDLVFSIYYRVKSSDCLFADGVY